MIVMMVVGDVWFSGSKLWLLKGERWCLLVVYDGLLLATKEQGTVVREGGEWVRMGGGEWES